MLQKARPERGLIIATAIAVPVPVAGRASENCPVQLRKYLKILEGLRDGVETGSQVALAALALLSYYHITDREYLISTNSQILIFFSDLFAKESCEVCLFNRR